MSKRYIVPVALIVILVLLAVGVVACKKKAPVTVKPNEPVEIVEEEPPPPPPTRWPYTGMVSEDASAVLKRPISVKIENSALARPQMGMSHADLVYETIAEGGITRFNCIFHSDIPKEVGPVRSARLSDLWIVPQYGDALFFFSGSNGQVRRGIARHGLADLQHGKVGSPLYYRVSFRHMPHNLYLNVKDARKVAKSKGFPVKGKAEYAPLNFLREGEERVQSIETTATKVTIPFSAYFKMSWKWNEDKGVYLRSTNDKKQVYAENDKQVAATNVVVLWAKYTPQGTRDHAGNGTYDIKLGGKGKAAVFMNGKRISGTWKAKRNAPPALFDKEGNEIALNPGKTWFEVPPTDIKIKSK